MSLSTFGKRLSVPSGDSEKSRSRALRDETIPSQPDVSMQICFVIALVGLTINFASPDFAQQNDTVDAEIAQQVRALASNYDAAFNRQDAVTIAGLYAEDAVFNTPEGTFHGRQAIEELYAKQVTGVPDEAHESNKLKEGFTLALEVLRYF